jgi:hypothetical protein
MFNKGNMFMSEQVSSTSAQSMMIQLEIVSENNERQVDIADIDEVSRNIVDSLRENGYTVRPHYTGRMGSPVYDVLIHTYHLIHNNEELLVALFTFVTAVITFISNRTKQDVEEKKQHTLAQVEITFPILDDKGTPVTIKASDPEAAITLLKQIKEVSSQETKTVGSENRVKIKINAANKKRR